MICSRSILSSLNCFKVISDLIYCEIVFVLVVTVFRDVKMMKLSPIRDWSPVEVEAWVNGLEEGMFLRNLFY